MFSRRDFHRLSLAGLAGAMGVGGIRAARAKPGDYERKFLFVFAKGGWDYGYVFAPLFDNAYYDPDTSSETAQAHGLSFVDSEERPSVRSFFEDYGDRACIINGMEVRSITHERCTRIVWTGGSSDDADDFPSIIAAHSTRDLLLPYTVLSGPSFSSKYASQVVRVGSSNQLPTLLDGSALASSDVAVSALQDAHPSVDELVDAFVRTRASELAQVGGVGRPQRLAELHDTVLTQLNGLYDLSGTLSFGETPTIEVQLGNALDLLELGAARCVTLQHEGLYDMTWDSHSVNGHQSTHYELLFELLNTTMAELDSRPGQASETLAEEVTIVVISEMGRDPRLNSLGGKHHWTHTSAMLVGSGIAGGQTVGKFGEFCTGEPVDLATGEATSSGTNLVPGHLGATLMHLADVDPAEYLGDTEPISAALEDA